MASDIVVYACMAVLSVRIVRSVWDYLSLWWAQYRSYKKYLKFDARCFYAEEHPSWRITSDSSAPSAPYQLQRLVERDDGSMWQTEYWVADMGTACDYLEWLSIGRFRGEERPRYVAEEFMDSVREARRSRMRCKDYMGGYNG